MGFFKSILRGVGALAGNALLPGLGGVAGGFLGGKLAGLFGGGGGGAAPDPAQAYRSRLVDRYSREALADPTQTAGYGAASAEARADTAREADVDAARVAASGGSGGEGEVALAAGRGSRLTTRLRGAVQDAQARQDGIAGMMLADNNAERDRAERRGSARWGALGNAVSVAASVLPDLVGGGGGGNSGGMK